ncbi:hypothetical protein [Bradyrhizobium sp. dw_78]|uniref:hypothetical protein n=1 Tax=Bradyrhizobium sp. dw_78 TaxID=2719793 RepID=UPI001BD49B23|nr:hypothetical protein [Bradyrhizobium sp. dw_78]
MSLAVITVNVPSPALSTRAQETASVARACELAAQSIRGAGGAQASGEILDTGANLIGSWTYTAVATS